MKPGRKRTTPLRVIRIIHMLQEGMNWSQIGGCQDLKNGGSAATVANAFIHRVLNEA